MKNCVVVGIDIVMWFTARTMDNIKYRETQKKGTFKKPNKN
jgi:hypothetical protein